ncbi:hypothetical protein KC669_00855 [Candidatus Dojkabacteria bacterium]|uniref:Uncharacterized protein n=1 Tax=Candidatus Dojkabacteria bacterium TaxID=2099670 RepID=A0A955RL29_9BACT|nr:hypothetical protein [Candidatus Dojkabacteria bacterium]
MNLDQLLNPFLGWNKITFTCKNLALDFTVDLSKDVDTEYLRAIVPDNFLDQVLEAIKWCSSLKPSQGLEKKIILVGNSSEGIIKIITSADLISASDHKLNKPIDVHMGGNIGADEVDYINSNDYSQIKNLIEQ